MLHYPAKYCMRLYEGPGTEIYVLHGFQVGAPTKYAPGQMRRWIKEDNKNITILGIRWLWKECRRAGKAASLLVIYLQGEININQGIRMGRRIFRTTCYDWGG